MASMKYTVPYFTYTESESPTTRLSQTDPKSTDVMIDEKNLTWKLREEHHDKYIMKTGGDRDGQAFNGINTEILKKTH